MIDTKLFSDTISDTNNKSQAHQWTLICLRANKKNILI